GSDRRSSDQRSSDRTSVRVTDAAETDGSAQVPVQGRGQARGLPSPFAIDELLLAADRLQAERWYPARPDRSGPTPDALLLKSGLTSRLTRTRANAVRAVGRFENALDVPSLTPFLSDPDAGVRREAAQAVAQSLRQSRAVAVLPARNAL